MLNKFFIYTYTRNFCFYLDVLLTEKGKEICLGERFRFKWILTTRSLTDIQSRLKKKTGYIYKGRKVTFM